MRTFTYTHASKELVEKDDIKTIGILRMQKRHLMYLDASSLNLTEADNGKEFVEGVDFEVDVAKPESQAFLSAIPIPKQGGKEILRRLKKECMQYLLILKRKLVKLKVKMNCG